MEPSYLFIYKHSIHELFRMKENNICHIACIKRYLYNNNLFPANLEQLIIMTEVTTCISVRLLNHIDCCFNNSTNWEFDQVGWSHVM